MNECILHKGKASIKKKLVSLIFFFYSFSICILLNLGYRSQVWSPYSLLNTIDLCTSPLLLYEVSSKEQVPFWLDYSFLYQKGKYELYLYYLSSKNWELEDLLRPAPTLCWGRATGVIWEIWNLPVSGPPRASLNSSSPEKNYYEPWTPSFDK